MSVETIAVAFIVITVPPALVATSRGSLRAEVLYSAWLLLYHLSLYQAVYQKSVERVLGIRILDTTLLYSRTHGLHHSVLLVLRKQKPKESVRTPLG
jgi:hypothetical protein